MLITEFRLTIPSKMTSKTPNCATKPCQQEPSQSRVQTPPRTLTSPTKKPRRFFVCSFDEEETKEELYAWETKEDDGNDGFKGQ